MGSLAWLRRRDPDLAVLRRAARTAVVTPAVFGFSVGVIGDPVIATYAAFGSFALLLFVDFTGPTADRIRAQIGLGAVGLVSVALGTAVAPVTWLATLTMAVLAFAVLFARIEDVAIGCAVSLAVGLLFWPRGAGRALNIALAAAYSDSADYLRAAVDFGITRCDGSTTAAPPPQTEAQRAAAAARRLDDAFRTYLGERGAKPVPLTDVTRLVTGVAGLRLAADAVLDLWSTGDGGATGDRTAAREQLQTGGHAVAGWYTALAAAVTGSGAVPDPLPADTATTSMLRAAVERDLAGDGGAATTTAVRMVWTGGHLDAARRLQPTLLAPAREVAAF